MENLSEAPVKRKTGLDRLKKMKNDMFGGKKEQKEEEEMQQQVCLLQWTVEGGHGLPNSIYVKY